MHIGIFGHYGNQNLGDEAIIEAAIDSVTRHFDRPEISCFSIRPEDTAERHGVPAYPIIYREGASGSPGEEEEEKEPAEEGAVEAPPEPEAAPPRQGLVRTIKGFWLVRLPYRAMSGCLGLARALRTEIPFLLDSYRRLKGIDLLIVAGSNQFLDNFGGVMGFPATLLKWSILCKLARTKLAFVSVGAGPINSSASKLLIRLSLRFADYLSYRDEASRDLIEGSSRRFRGKVFPDLASNLRFAAAEKAPHAPEKPIVGINPMPMYDSRYWCEADDGRYQAYVEKLARFAVLLRDQGFPIFFFGTQRKDYDAIDDVLEQLPREGAAPANGALVRDASSVQDLMKIISGSDIVVATRFHGTVLSLVADVPVFGICYYRKAADLLREMDQDGYFVMLDDFDVEEALGKFLSLAANLEQEKRKIHETSARYHKLVEQQYEDLASLFSR